MAVTTEEGRGSRGRALFVALVLGLSLGLLLTGCGKRAERPGSLELARTYYEKGQFRQAAEEARRVVQAQPENLDARRSLALALAAGGDAKAALEQYRRVLEADPEDHLSYYRAAGLEMVLGLTKGAADDLAKAARVSPGEARYLDELARVDLQLGKAKEAAALWGRAAGLKKVGKDGRKQYLMLQGQAFQAAKMYDDAKASFKKALRLDPGDEALKKIVRSFDKGQ